MERYDVVIASAGCAGLSLAVHLLEEAKRLGVPVPHTLIVDPREHFGSDRTWCYFDTEPHPFSGCATHSWKTVSTALDGEITTLSVEATPYTYLPSEAFYREALARIDHCEHITLRLGSSAHAFDQSDEGVQVRLNASGESRTVKARWAFDGRPPSKRTLLAAHLLQHFHGWFVKTKTPAFDPNCAQLMHFERDTSSGVHFTYLLPFSPTYALVEDTYFTRALRSQSHYESNLQHALAKRSVKSFDVVHVEHGVLPMDADFGMLKAHERVVPIGLRAGAARPSTGYAFSVIQRHANHLAKTLLRSDNDASKAFAFEAHLHKPAVLRYDRVLLSYLGSNNTGGADVLHNLFKRVQPDALVRFLSGHPKAADLAELLFAVPSLPFATHATRSLLPTRSTEHSHPRRAQRL